MNEPINPQQQQINPQMLAMMLMQNPQMAQQMQQQAGLRGGMPPPAPSVGALGPPMPQGMGMMGGY